MASLRRTRGDAIHLSSIVLPQNTRKPISMNKDKLKISVALAIAAPALIGLTAIIVTADPTGPMARYIGEALTTGGNGILSLCFIGIAVLYVATGLVGALYRALQRDGGAIVTALSMLTCVILLLLYWEALGDGRAILCTVLGALSMVTGDNNLKFNSDDDDE